MNIAEHFRCTRTWCTALGSLLLTVSLQAQATLLVGNTSGNNVVAYDEVTGSYLGVFIGAGSGGLASPDDLTYGPDGNLYVSSSSGNTSGQILRYNGSTGAFMDVFAASSSLRRPYGSAFGPDGNLYVASFRSDEILRYDGSTGALIDVFAKGNGTAGGLLNGPNDLLFGPDGKLYVTTQGSVANASGGISYQFDSQVLRYDVGTGVGSVLASPTPAPGSAGYVSMLGVAFGPDGLLYTTDYAGGIRSYDSATGTLVQTIATGALFGGGATTLGNLTFGPDGKVYVPVFDGNGSTGKNGIASCVISTASCTLLVSDSDHLFRPIGITYVATPVPEPASVALLSAGLGLLAWRVRRRPGTNC